MNFKNFLIAATIMAASNSAHAAANLIVNGSFEQSNPSFIGGFATFNAGSSALTGWTIGGDSIDYINQYWQAGDGNYSVDLSGNYDGLISQTFATEIGQQYHVSFSIAGNPDDGDKIKYMQVGLSNNPIYTFDSTGYTHSSMGWVKKSFDFIATHSSSTLFFASIQDSASGVALDNVSVSAVPEPETNGMMLAGLALMAGIARRRNQLKK